MSHLSAEAVETLARILNPTSADDIRTLGDIAGLDPAEDLRYCIFSGCDFEDSDIDGWDFTGTILNGANLSRVRNITKAKFDRDTDLTGAILPLGIRAEQLIR